MTVQELIEKLGEVENKDLEVKGFGFMERSQPIVDVCIFEKIVEIDF